VNLLARLDQFLDVVGVERNRRWSTHCRI
jgi:hypothetical protein